MPIIVAAPLARKLSLDLTTHYASSHVETAGGSEALSGLTDTQLRLPYTLARDRLVGSLSLNLPTGTRRLSTGQFVVAGATGSNYLSFPVANSGTAEGVTGGVAYAQRLGAWNVGASGSLRYLRSYAPFLNDPLSHAPGLEGRLPAGADRLVGERSRLVLGLTLSTFSTDVFSGSSVIVPGWYSPGTRFIGELMFVRVLDRATLAVSAWDFYRLAGLSSNSKKPETKENVFSGEVRLTYPVTTRLQLEPLLVFRQWSPADYRGGRLKSGGLVARAGLTERLSAAVSGSVRRRLDLRAGPRLRVRKGLRRGAVPAL